MDREGIDKFLADRTEAGDSISYHFDLLTDLARQCRVIVEFGVRKANSSGAFLRGLPDDGVLHSVDPYWAKHHDVIRAPLIAAAGRNWRRYDMSSLDFKPVACDLLMHDSLHNYDHLSAELRIFAPHTAKFILIDNVLGYGEHGQPRFATPGTKGVRGMTEAIDEFLRAHPEWQERSLEKRGPNPAAGEVKDALLVLEKV